MKKTVLLIAITALISFGIGVPTGSYLAMGPMAYALDVQAHAHTWKFSDIADEAYRDADTNVAIWISERFLGSIEEEIDRDYESDFLTERDLQYFLVVTHARLAMLYEGRDEEERRHHVEKARSVAKDFFQKEMTEAELFSLLEGRDQL